LESLLQNTVLYYLLQDQDQLSQVYLLMVHFLPKRVVLVETEVLPAALVDMVAAAAAVHLHPTAVPAVSAVEVDMAEMEVLEDHLGAPAVLEDMQDQVEMDQLVEVQV
jgi:hypothetical protein